MLTLVVVVDLVDLVEVVSGMVIVVEMVSGMVVIVETLPFLFQTRGIRVTFADTWDSEVCLDVVNPTTIPNNEDKIRDRTVSRMLDSRMFRNKVHMGLLCIIQVDQAVGLHS